VERSNVALDGTATTAHRALDRVATIMLEVQHLRRQLDDAGILHRDSYHELLTRISDDLHELGAELQHKSDGPPS